MAKAAAPGSYATPTWEKAQFPAGIFGFFDALTQGVYLHTLQGEKLYKSLIDCYRTRAEDDFNFANEAHGLDPRKDFLEFLGKAEDRRGLLPWNWIKDDKKACMELAATILNQRTNKAKVQKDWGEDTMPMQLRMLAEKVYRAGLTGGFGTGGYVEDNSDLGARTGYQGERIDEWEANDTSTSSA
ncbi:Ankyrin repeat and MYND domain-containing protein 2 [Elasticomyces elasticus]|nr:Ankyrin repeat and MYND domain-containing protein 2 [Elasticomyces elasticus]